VASDCHVRASTASVTSSPIIRFNTDETFGKFDIPMSDVFPTYAPDAYAARGSEDIQDARPLAMPLAIEVHQIGGLVSTLISDNAQERHSALLALLRPGW